MQTQPLLYGCWLRVRVQGQTPVQAAHVLGCRLLMRDGAKQAEAGRHAFSRQLTGCGGAERGRGRCHGGCCAR